MASTPSERRILRGKIHNYRVRRATEDFFFSASERKGMAATGVVASAMGLLGVGVALMGESTDTYEEADFAEFEVEGECVQAFLWLSPFAENDEVEVVAEKVGTVWKAFGIVCPVDRIIALHPHYSRGSKAHWRAVVKWWLIGGGGVAVFTALVALIVHAFSGGGEWLSVANMIILGSIGGCLFSLSSPGVLAANTLASCE